MTQRRRPGMYLAWVDMLYGHVATFVFLFIVAFLLIHPVERKKDGVQLKAEYLITAEWPDGSFDDIDLHLQLPDGRMVNFKSREVDYALLDHDDVGINGHYKVDTGEMMLLPHKEVITVRAIVPGTYVANLHVFRVNDHLGSVEETVKLPYKVKVTLTRLNPRLEDVATVDVEMTELGQQKTAFAFTVKDGGDVEVDRDADVPFIPLVEKAPEMGPQ